MFPLALLFHANTKQKNLYIMPTLNDDKSMNLRTNENIT